jgi:integrase
MAKARKLVAARLHLLSTREVLAAGDGDHADGGGLLLRVRGESVNWGFRFTSPTCGKRREMGLGVCHRGSVAQAGDSLTGARDLAHRARELLRMGTDPIDHRDAQREAGQVAAAARQAEKARDRWTLARCARDYHERVIEPTRTTKHTAQWISSLENHMPTALWRKPIADVEPPELLAVLTGIRHHDRARNVKDTGGAPLETIKRIRERLDAIFEDAIFHKRATVNVAHALSRKLREGQRRKPAGQHAALPFREAPAFMQRLRSMEGTAARTLELALLTAARTSEALGAQWSEIDFEARTWLVPPERMKPSGKDKAEPHLVHLSDRAVEILRGQVGQHQALVFPSTMKTDAPQSNMAMLAVLDRMGERPRTTVHGLCRATFSTWAAAGCGCAPSCAARVPGVPGT